MGEKKLVTLPQAIELVNKSWGLEGANWIQPQTIYNATWSGRIKNHGRRNKALFDPVEVLREFGKKSA